MRAGPIVLLVWGALLWVHTGLQFAFGTNATQVALLGGAGTACVLAALAWWALRAWPPRERVYVVPDLSLPTALVAVGLAAALVGAELGPTLIAVGAGCVAIGAGGVVRELRAERRR